MDYISILIIFVIFILIVCVAIFHMVHSNTKPLKIDNTKSELKKSHDKIIEMPLRKEKYPLYIFENGEKKEFIVVPKQTAKNNSSAKVTTKKPSQKTKTDTIAKEKRVKSQKTNNKGDKKWFMLQVTMQVIQQN